MSDEDQQRLEERKLRAKQALEQTQIQHTCDVISISMVKNYKLRCAESIKDLPFFPSEIEDYIRILERIIEPVMKKNTDNINLAAYVQGVVDEIIIDLPPVFTEPIVQTIKTADAATAAQYNRQISHLSTIDITENEFSTPKDTTIEELHRRVSQLEFDVRKLKSDTKYIQSDDLFASGRTNPLGGFLEQIQTSSFLDD